MNLRKKGIIKEGLKYFSQMFEEEQQQKEIQIGLPTDVKHVAHIGWDGPSTNAPSWMNEFKSQSAPLDGGGSDALSRQDEISEGKGNAGISSSAREMPGLPKASRVRHPSMDSLASVDDSPPGSPSSTARSNKNKEKESTKTSGSGRRPKDKAKHHSKAEPTAGDEGGSHVLPNIPKKISRRKKSKDSESSVKSSTKQSKRGSRGGSLIGSEDGSSRSNGPGSSMGTLQEE
ncbi:hypothetical protein V2J09_002237 [Rumex salicifolius]